MHEHEDDLDAITDVYDLRVMVRECRELLNEQYERIQGLEAEIRRLRGDNGETQSETER